MNLEELYKKVFNICVGFAVYNKTNIIEEMYKILPEIKKNSMKILENNIYNMEDADYNALRTFLLEILQDIIQGIEQRDTVLLEDVCEYGLKKFLELFFTEEKLLDLRKEASDE